MIDLRIAFLFKKDTSLQKIQWHGNVLRRRNKFMGKLQPQLSTVLERDWARVRAMVRYTIVHNHSNVISGDRAAFFRNEFDLRRSFHY